jgi:hypothetical protein
MHLLWRATLRGSPEDSVHLRNPLSPSTRESEKDDREVSGIFQAVRRGNSQAVQDYPADGREAERSPLVEMFGPGDQVARAVRSLARKEREAFGLVLSAIHMCGEGCRMPGGRVLTEGGVLLPGVNLS